MKFGVNTFIWSAEFNQSNFPLLPIIKEAGFDGVEVLEAQMHRKDNAYLQSLKLS